MIVIGGKSTLLLAASEEVVMLLQQRAGARLHLPLHVGVVMLPLQTLTGTTMRMHWRGTPRTMMLTGTAWIQLQEEELQEAVVMVSET